MLYSTSLSVCFTDPRCSMTAYISIQVAQQQGLFTENEGQPLDLKLLDRLESIEDRWYAWSRVESVKRYVQLISET